MIYLLYGLSNCDVTKKAIKWLNEHNVQFEFKNNKIEIFSEEKLQQWCAQVGWEKLLNKKGKVFRGLHPAIQKAATNQEMAIEIMSGRTSTIKRPIIEKDGKIITVGFDERKFEIAYW